jgi:chromosome segregation ATPase
MSEEINENRFPSSRIHGLFYNIDNPNNQLEAFSYFQRNVQIEGIIINNQLDSQLLSLSNKLDTVESDIETIESNILTIETNAELLQTTVSDLSSAKETLTLDMSNMQSDLQLLQNDSLLKSDFINSNIFNIQTNSDKIQTIEEKTNLFTVNNNTLEINNQVDELLIVNDLRVRGDIFLGSGSPLFSRDNDNNCIHLQVPHLYRLILESPVYTSNDINTSLSEHNISHSNNILDLQTITTSNTSDINNLQSDVTTLEGNVLTNSNNIIDLQTITTTHTSDISVLQSDVTTLEGNVLTNTNDITTLKTDVISLEENIITNYSTINNEKLILNNDVYVVSEHQSLSQRLINLNDQISAANINIGNNTSDIHSNNLNLSAAQNDIATLQNRVTVLETNLNLLLSKIYYDQNNDKIFITSDINYKGNGIDHNIFEKLKVNLGSPDQLVYDGELRVRNDIIGDKDVDVGVKLKVPETNDLGQRYLDLWNLR